MIDNKQALLDRLVVVARDAGDAVMEIYNSDDHGVQIKSDQSPLTKADLAANTIIINGLQELTPNIPVVSEESLIPDEVRLASDAIWLVDPIDGTKEFISKNGQFTICVGLIERGEPVLGLQFAPALGELYYGAKGLGAWKSQDGGEPQPIHVNRQKRPAIATVSRSHSSSEQDEWLTKHNVQKIVSLGSAIKFSHVADGSIDVYLRLGPQMEWDNAAGDAVLRAAGGTCVEYETGKPMVYNKSDLKTPYFIASNGRFS